MDLLINYGTTASAGGQPVIAEIQLNQFSLNEYNLTFIQGSANDVSGASFAAPTVSRIPKTEIINNTIIFNNTNWTLIHFWNNNTYLGHFAQTSFNNNSYWETNSLGIWNNTIPTNATHFAINSFVDTGGDPLPNGISFAQFQTLTISYTDPEPSATTTFYDSYPDGNVIGTTNGTEFVGDVNSVSLTHVSSSVLVDNLTYASSTRMNRTNWIALNTINNPSSLIINNAQYLSQIVVYPNFQLINNLQTGTITYEFPAGTTHFGIQSRYNNNDPLHNSPISLANFQTVTVSAQEPGYLQIDPPTGKRIKQIALKGL
jgi:hypothetical protein